MRWLCMFLLGIWPFLSAWAEGDVHLVLSEPGGAYAEVAEAFKRGLGDQAKVKVWSMQDLTAADVPVMGEGHALLVPVGMKASRFVAENHTGQGDVLGLLVPEGAANALRWRSALHQNKASFVYLDQPLSRSIKLIRAALPQARRVGVLVSTETSSRIGKLNELLEDQGLVAVVREVDSAQAVNASLRNVLAEVDVLLLLPDTLVVNNTNLQNLLMASYRVRVPVIGFSAGMVKSGVLASVFSTPAQIGQEGGLMARRWAQSGKLPVEQVASRFSVQINHSVARALGLLVLDQREISQRLGAQDAD